MEDNPKKLLKFLSFVKQQDYDFFTIYNENRRRLDEILVEIDWRDEDIQEYKTTRGIPLNLSSEVRSLYSMSEDVSFFQLKQMKEDHERKRVNSGGL